MLETVRFIYEHWILTTWFIMALPFLRMCAAGIIREMWKRDED